MGLTILLPKQTGVCADDRQGMEDYVYTWRLIGHLIGIHEKFNLCAETLDVTVERLSDLMNLVLRPALQVDENRFYKMNKNIMDGLRHINPILDHDAFMYFIKRLSGVPGFTYWMSENQNGQLSEEYVKLGRISRLILFILVITIENLIHFNFIRKILNFLLVVNNLLAYYFPIHAIIDYGYKMAYVRVE